MDFCKSQIFKNKEFLTINFFYLKISPKSPSNLSFKVLLKKENLTTQHKIKNSDHFPINVSVNLLHEEKN